jgi:hypothetical protein
MRVLFDQGTPVPLRKLLTGHYISTAYELGWGTLQNGELLSQAQASGFAVLVTTDQNLAYQQNLNSRTIAVIVIKSTRWLRIARVVADIQTALDLIHSNEYIEINVP